jgi:hypothetical protein
MKLLFLEFKSFSCEKKEKLFTDLLFLPDHRIFLFCFKDFLIKKVE